MKLRKATIEDLRNKCPMIVELLRNNLAMIKDIQGLLDYININTTYDLQNEITKYFDDIYLFNSNDEYLGQFLESYVDRNIDKIRIKTKTKSKSKKGFEKLSEEKQIEVFREVDKFKEETLDNVMDFLDSFDRDTVLRKLKEYGYID